MTDIQEFVRESNRIEGIIREPLGVEIAATEAFLALPELRVRDMKNLVAVYQPDARLRDEIGLNVRVGGHIAPPGGRGIPDILHALLIKTTEPQSWTAHQVHQEYEHLHPFTDGNGRSGRALWLWMHKGSAPLGFLHHWYYESLQESRG